MNANSPNQVVPKEIQLKNSIPLFIEFHPSQKQLSVGLIDGNVSCYECEGSTAKRLFLSKHHKGSVRCVRYNEDGTLLYSCSTDLSIQALDTTTHQVILKKAKAHEAEINTLIPLSDNTVASADDAGTIRLWDLRAKTMVLGYKEHEAAVNALVAVNDELLSVGEDGYLTCYDTKQRALVARSDRMENEMHCMQLVCDARRLAVGQSDGAISLWNYGWWGDMKDRIPGHPEPINAMVKLADRTLLTGGADGKLRIVTVAPNKVERKVGSIGFLPVECMSISGDKALVATSTYDETIRLWNASKWVSCAKKQLKTLPKKRNDDQSDSDEDSDSWKSTDEDSDEDQAMAGNKRNQQKGVQRKKRKP